MQSDIFEAGSATDVISQDNTFSPSGVDNEYILIQILYCIENF